MVRDARGKLSAKRKPQEARLNITHGPSAELGIGPPQAAWRGAVEHPSGRGPLCAGEALLQARTQASVALFKLGVFDRVVRLSRAVCISFLKFL